MSHSKSSAPRGPAGFSTFLPLLDFPFVFTSSDGRAFVRVPEGNGRATRTLHVRSRAFREWLFDRCYDLVGTIPTNQAFDAILRQLESQAVRDPDTCGFSVRHRVDRRGPGTHPDRILINLANLEGQYVEISAAGWKINAADGTPFETSLATRPLPAPEPPASSTSGESNAPLQLLRSTLNLGPSGGPAWLRVFAWLLSALRTDGPCPVLILRGPCGCGKSIAARVLHFLLDPTTSPLTPLPSSVRQLHDLARNNFALAFDHVSALSPRLSDALCRLSTGAGIAAREPGHTEAAQLWVKRPILLTVTDDFVPSPELDACSLTVTLPGLTVETRRPEPDVLGAVDPHFPVFLGALYDAVAATLHPNAPFQPHRTRHSHSLALAVAAAPNLGCTEEEVRAAFDPEPPSDPIVDSVRSLLRANPRFSGTATTLASALGLTIAPKVLSERLKKSAPALSSSGIQITSHRQHAGSRIIELRASPDSQPPQPEPLNPPESPTPCVTQVGQTPRSAAGRPRPARSRSERAFRSSSRAQRANPPAREASAPSPGP